MSESFSTRAPGAVLTPGRRRRSLPARAIHALAVALIGTTANRSLWLPVISESIDMMIAGRFLAASPGSLAPNRTSQTCPRDGSGDSVTDGAVPILLLC